MNKKYKICNTSIKDLANKITHNLVILPALQREYIWKQRDICRLFDSLMQGYPINTMMFWKSNNLGQMPISFYKFLKPKYQESVDKNESFNTDFIDDKVFYDIVIDGQQRITSLWIGLCGSYQTPKAKELSYLHLRLDYQPNENDEFKYDFKFLTDSKAEERGKKGEVWFKVNHIISDKNYRANTLKNIKWGNKVAIGMVLDDLYKMIKNPNIINYYEIKNDNIDEVLEVFVRTNSGGYTLKKSDLLMSALTVKWGETNLMNAREYVDEIIREVKDCGYEIDKDWVFNAFLMLTNTNDLSPKPSTFMSEVSQNIFDSREEIKDSIIKAFKIVSNFHLIEKGLTTKLAVIPIAYFISMRKLYNTCTLDTNDYSNVLDQIRKFLFRAIVKNLFEASTYDILKKLRDIIRKESKKAYFPYEEIEQEYDELKITEDDKDKLLLVRKSNAFPILNIIYSLGYRNGLSNMKLEKDEVYDVDHMHPKIEFENQSDMTYDTIVNLELLDKATNRSKNKRSLNQWLQDVEPRERQKLIESHFIEKLPLEHEKFNEFVDGRKKLLKAVLDKL